LTASPVVSRTELEINRKQMSLVIISRRSIQRAGTRLFARGADVDGHVANFVETEQIVELPNAISSFVQIRGSIPLVWNQMPNIKYKPKPQLSQTHNQQDAFQKHIDQLLNIYGKLCIVSLINHHGQESVLGNELTGFIGRFCQTNNVIRYEPFDFHSECGQNRWHRLSKLIARIAPEHQEMSCFCISKEGNILSAQDGVFRSNCIDSLDRTNVVQSLIARTNLEAQLTKFGVIQAGQKIDDFDHVAKAYRIGL
jgi:hypothetical protein